MLDPEGEAADIRGTGEGAGFTTDGSFAVLNFFFYRRIIIIQKVWCL
jgi:hypothetical protein